jgi:hypothetical protein
MAKLRVSCAMAFLVLIPCFAHSQTNLYNPNQEVRVSGLPPLTASSQSESAALVTALEIIFRDKDVCCEKDSALVDVPLADSLPLKSLTDKLQGRHLLSDGRPIMITAEYVSQESTTPNKIITPLRENHPLLLQWESHVYVLYGVIFDETYDNNGPHIFAIRKLLLLDPRFSDNRREVTFNRETDDWTKVQGLLLIGVAVQ